MSQGGPTPAHTSTQGSLAPSRPGRIYLSKKTRLGDDPAGLRSEPAFSLNWITPCLPAIHYRLGPDSLGAHRIDLIICTGKEAYSHSVCGEGADNGAEGELCLGGRNALFR